MALIMPIKTELRAERLLKIKVSGEIRNVECSRCEVQTPLKRFKETSIHENRPRTHRKTLLQIMNTRYR